MTTDTDLRALDARLAELLGWTYRTCNVQSQHWHRPDGSCALPHEVDWHKNPSRMLALLEAMRTQGWSWSLDTAGSGTVEPTWLVSVFALGQAREAATGIADTLPEAVARAALAALEAEGG